MILEQIEELLSKEESAFRHTTKASGLALLAALPGILPLFLPEPYRTTILLLLLAFLASLLGLVLSRSGKKISEMRRLESELSSARENKSLPRLDDQEFSILCMIYDNPGKVESVHFQERLGLSDGDLHCSLKGLFDLDFIEAPVDNLRGPHGYWPSSSGCQYVKHRRKPNKSA